MGPGWRSRGRLGVRCSRPHPQPARSQLGSPVRPGGPRCSSCSLVSDVLRVQRWGRLSSDWGQGRLVSPLLAPAWPWGLPGTHLLCAALQLSLPPPCPLPGGKRVGRQAGGRGAAVGAGAAAWPSKGLPAARSPLSKVLRWAPPGAQPSDGPTCGRTCTAPTARGVVRGTLGPRAQEGLRASVAPSCGAPDQPGGQKTGVLGAD